MLAFPIFKYHPEPLKTGSLVASSAVCKCCGQARGYIYAGPVHTHEELSGQLCPWCIASGAAADQLEAIFVEDISIGDGELAEPIMEEVSFRTPGFKTWAEECWPSCCNDATAFLGAAGHIELQAMGPAAVEAVRSDAELVGPEWENYLTALNLVKGPTAYVFKCLHCAQFHAYTDGI